MTTLPFFVLQQKDLVMYPWRLKCIPSAKCNACNKPSVTTHEKYMQQTKCQEEYVQQAKY